MRYLKAILLFTFGSLALWIPEAHALLCVLPYLSGVTATSTHPAYNPFSSSAGTQTISFTVNALANLGTCNYFVVLAAGSGGNAANRRLVNGSTNLTYVAYTDSGMSNTLLAETNAGANNVITGSFSLALGLTQNRTHTFTWSIPPLQVVPHSAGAFYTDASVVLELYEGTITGTHTRVATAPITFRSTVTSAVDVAITGTGGAFAIGSTSRNVDFGTATSGDIRNFDLVVRSNDGYRLSMSSAHNQTLWRGTTATSGTIPYSLTVNNVSTNLSSGAAVSIGTFNGITAAAGTNLPVRVTLGTVPPLQPAGTYTDTLSVTVSAY